MSGGLNAGHNNSSPNGELVALCLAYRKLGRQRKRIKTGKVN